MNNTSRDIDFTIIEQQLMQALISGASNKQIARELGKSEFTVRNQLSAIFQKIGVSNRMQAAFWFRSQMASRSEWSDGAFVLLPGSSASKKMNQPRG